jgi:hypothetical protein
MQSTFEIAKRVCRLHSHHMNTGNYVIQLIPCFVCGNNFAMQTCIKHVGAREIFSTVLAALEFLLDNHNNSVLGTLCKGTTVTVLHCLHLGEPWQEEINLPHFYLQ